MNRRQLLAGAAAAAAASCLRSRAATGSGDPPALSVDAPAGFTAADGYKLVKDWDFKTRIATLAALRDEFHTRYIYGNGTTDHLNDEWTRYRDHDNHVFTPEGLSLVARPMRSGRVEQGGIESGMLRSKWTSKYGVYEIRMRVPRGRGTWSAFWLNPEDMRWPPEIDVVEIVDNGTDTSRDSFHYLHGVGAKGHRPTFTRIRSNHTYRPGFDYASDFHVFSVEWTADAVRHFVDGVLVNDTGFRWLHDDGSDGGPAHVLVDLAIGGKWPGAPDPSTLPASLTIRSIRVWRR